MTLTKKINHVTEAVGHYVEQFKDKPKLAAFITAFVNQIQDLENVGWDLYTNRWIDTAVGAQLDVIGSIVGEEREGRSDEDYRLAIKARIQINLSEATPEDILTGLVNFYNRAYEMTETGYAGFIIRLVDALVDGVDPDPETFLAFLNDMNGAGIAAWFQYSIKDDDKTFTFASGDTPEADVNQGFLSAGLFTAIASTGSNRAMTSPDGINWTSRSTLGVSSGWISIAWSPELELFVAVAISGSTNERVMTSPDGITWTLQSSPTNAWTSVTWSSTLGLFVVVANAGTNLVMTSPDGINWTARTAADNSTWNSIAWSQELGLFVAVALSGTSRVMTSPDGINWTARTVPDLYVWRSVVWAPQLRLFVAVASSGTARRVMTSPDGINWTPRSAGVPTNTWLSVTWSPDLNLLVAVASSGTNLVMTSPDGINWTPRTEAETNVWRNVCWSSIHGLFVAVSEDGTNRVMTSPDGINWTSRLAAAQNSWQDIVAGAELGGVWSEIIGG